MNISVGVTGDKFSPIIEKPRAKKNGENLRARFEALAGWTLSLAEICI
jgi:hypothetical protein